ncbi:MAG: response regulator [Polyangiaceae bacterium]
MPKPRGETMKGHTSPSGLGGDELHALVERALRQAGAGAHAGSVLAKALATVGLERTPVAATPLTSFVLGPLFDEMMKRSGVDAAKRAVGILRPVLQKRSEHELGEVDDADAPTILVVDENIATRARVLSILSEVGYEAISAPDGNVALAMCVRCRPQLVITDLGVGGSAGRQLAARLRVAFVDDAPPLVILTDDPTWREPDGRIPVVTKPVDRERLLAAVLPLIGEPPAPRESA